MKLFNPFKPYIVQIGEHYYVRPSWFNKEYCDVELISVTWHEPNEFCECQTFELALKRLMRISETFPKDGNIIYQ